MTYADKLREQLPKILNGKDAKLALITVITLCLTFAEMLDESIFVNRSLRKRIQELNDLLDPITRK